MNLENTSNSDRPRLHRASCFCTSGISPLFSPLLVFYFLLVKSGYTAFFQDNLTITQRKKPAGKTASGEKSSFFKCEFYNNELHLSLFDAVHVTKLLLKYLRETGGSLDFQAFLLLFAPV